MTSAPSHTCARGTDCVAIRAHLAGLGGVILAAGVRSGTVVVPLERMRLRVSEGTVVTVLTPEPTPAAIDVRDPRQMALIATQLIALTQEQAREIADLRVDLSVAETKVEMQRPMVEAYEAFLDHEGLCNLRSAARAVDAPCEAFFDWLKKRGWLVKGGGWLQPGWERRRNRHFVVRMRLIEGKMRRQTHVTHGGLVWLRDRWQAKLLTDARDAERTREVEKARLQGDLGL